MKCSLRCTAKWFSFIYTCILASHLSQLLKNHPAMKEIWVQSLGLGRYAQRVMTSHSSILAWRISWTEEPSRLQSIGSQRVGHIWSNWACTGTHTYIYSFTNSFSIYVVTDFLAELPVVLKYSLFVIYFIHSGVYIYVNPQLRIHPPAPTCHLVTISLASM